MRGEEIAGGGGRESKAHVLSPAGVRGAIVGVESRPNQEIATGEFPGFGKGALPVEAASEEDDARFGVTVQRL